MQLAHFYQVPVYNIEKLLALEPKRIRSIEVVNDVCVIGNSSYGGFINILSKNGDMGGIDLPENSLFFRYQGYREMQGWESLYRIQKGIPRKDDTDPEGRGMELRNCLYWEPNLSLAPGQKMDIRLFSADQPGSYRMIVRGIAGDGRYLYGQCKFRIDPGTGR